MTTRCIGWLAVAVLAGCGGAPTDPCATESPCNADPRLTAADIKACQDRKNQPATKCSMEFATFNTCFDTRRVCVSDGKTAAFDTYLACQSESDAYTACLKR